MNDNLPPAPGWYPHPGGATNTEMWWTGEQWDTSHVRPVGGVPVPVQTVVVNQDRGKKVNHVLHFILTLCTLGLWLPVWFIVAVAKN